MGEPWLVMIEELARNVNFEDVTLRVLVFCFAFGQGLGSTSSMATVEFDVDYVAHLSRISLSREETEKLGPQLSHILDYIEKLKELDVNGVEPTAHAVPIVNVTRADEPRPSLPHDEALLNAPAQASGLFVVPKILE
jgi:aspartyl-tRNA(Asn)/glutamyl-tRNA(Gln) amidotransferase subunit C